MTDPKVIEKFTRSYIAGEIDECWNWNGALNSTGYGAFYVQNYRMTGAHRFALELKLGRPITPGLFVLHSCDNRACVNPNHLREGTAADNIKDARERNRLARKPDRRGQYAAGAKLTEEAVLSMLRDRIYLRMTNRELAAKYGVGKTIVGNILLGKKWAHIFRIGGCPSLESLNAVTPLIHRWSKR